MKIRKLIYTILAAAILFASCANDGDSGNGDNANPNQDVTHTLSFDANYPFEEEYYNFEKGEIVYPSEFTENGNTYYYDESYYGRQNSIEGSSITLEASPYAYSKLVRLDSNSFRRVKNFIFSYYNTKADGTGDSYRAGDRVTLSGDTTLYCFYEEEAANSVLDFSKCSSYSLKVGETVNFSNYINDVTEFYFDSNMSNFDSSVVEISSGNDVKTITAKGVGTTTLTAKCWDESDSRKWYCTVTVTSDDFSGKGIEYKLLGTWKYSGSSSSGTIVLNSDMTGHITATLQGSTVHDNDFTWSAYEAKNSSTTYQFLTFSGTGVSAIDCDHQVTNIMSTRFTMKGYLAFGMPSETTWYKQ